MSEGRTPARHKLHGRRRGKPLRPARQALIDKWLPRLQIELEEESAGLDPKAWFGDVQEVWLEIGFGKGEHLAWQAAQNPQAGIIGCEPFVTGVAGLMADVERGSLNNVRVFTDDAAWLLGALAPDTLSRAFLLFPDPWPKKRHNKRRFVNHENLDLLSRALKDGAEFRIATDHDDYANWIVRHMAARPDFEWLAEGPDDWRQRPADWPATRYEEKALEKGISAVYLRYRRRPR